MEGYILQDWGSFVVGSTVTSLVQDESAWLDLGAYRDLTLWTEVRAVEGGIDVDLYIDTAPSKDDSLFTDMARVALSGAESPVVTRILLVDDPSPPPARWLRWRLAPGATPASPWGATYRVHCSVNPLGRRVVSAAM